MRHFYQVFHPSYINVFRIRGMKKASACTDAKHKALTLMSASLGDGMCRSLQCCTSLFKGITDCRRYHLKQDNGINNWSFPTHSNTQIFYLSRIIEWSNCNQHQRIFKNCMSQATDFHLAIAEWPGIPSPIPINSITMKKFSNSQIRDRKTWARCANPF